MLDVADSLRTWLLTQMQVITGSDSRVLDIYLDKFPADAPAACLMLSQEPGSGDPDNPYIENAFVRVWVRHEKVTEARKMISNIDVCLNRAVKIDLDDNIRLLGSLRNVGPERIDFEDDNLIRYYSLYEIRAIARAADGRR